MLYPFVLEVRKEEKIKERSAADAKLFRLGARVLCWEPSYNEYYPATITNLTTQAGEESFEVRWHDGGEAPPVWVSKDYLHPLIEEEENVKSSSTQTNLKLYDLQHASPPRVRSARARMDEGMEVVDARARVQREAAVRKAYIKSLKGSLEETAKKLFKLLDSKSHGELYYQEAVSRIVTSANAKAFIDDHPALEPMLREEYVYKAWREVESDMSIPLVWREFREVCVNALMKARAAEETLSDEEHSEEGSTDPDAQEPAPHIHGYLSSEELIDEKEVEEMIEKAYKKEQEVLDGQLEELGWLRELESEAVSQFAEYESRVKMQAIEQEQLQLMQDECEKALRRLVSAAESDYSKVEMLCTERHISSPQQTDQPGDLDGLILFTEELLSQHVGNVRSCHEAIDKDIQETQSLLESLPDEEREEQEMGLQQKLSTCTETKQFLQGKLSIHESHLHQLQTLQRTTLATLRLRMQRCATSSESHESLTPIEEELEALKKRLAQAEFFCSNQSECIAACREVRDKLSREERRSVESIQALLDQKEAAFSRQESAAVAQTIATNDLERTRADEHATIVDRQVSSALSHIKEQMRKELAQRKAASAQRRAVAEEHLSRAESMLAAREMKFHLRALMEAEKESSEGADVDEEWLKKHMCQMKVLEKRMDDRETQWLRQNAKTIEGVTGSWLGLQEKERFEEEIRVLKRAKDEVEEACEEKLRQMSAQVAQLRGQSEVLARQKKGAEEALTYELEVLSGTFKSSIQYLHNELSNYKFWHKEEKRLATERMAATEEDCNMRVIQLKLKLVQLQEVADSRVSSSFKTPSLQLLITCF